MTLLVRDEGKFAVWGSTLDADAEAGEHVRAANVAVREGHFRAHYDRYLVDERTLANGLGEGAFAIDTRLRDALRRLAGTEERPLRAGPRRRRTP